jgi:hypothetical protein
VPGLKEFGDDGGTDVSSSSGDEYAHGNPPVVRVCGRKFRTWCSFSAGGVLRASRLGDRFRIGNFEALINELTGNQELGMLIEIAGNCLCSLTVAEETDEIDGGKAPQVIRNDVDIHKSGTDLVNSIVLHRCGHSFNGGSDLDGIGLNPVMVATAHSASL